MKKVKKDEISFEHFMQSKTAFVWAGAAMS